MGFTSDKSKFFQISPAAAEIFDYLHENPEVSEQSWEFEKGYVSENWPTTSADFWWGARSGWGKDKLTISASKNEDGSWNISHTIKRSSL